MKIALGIEYAGCNYYGWQKQSISPTIQETVESALSAIANEIINVYCAGRTDTGVHAIQQVIHFETSSQREPHSWILGANSKLPKDISIIWALNVDDSFHARFTAENRTYQYLILNRRSRPAILNGLVTWECQELDLKKMVDSSKCLLGEHDFSLFSKLNPEVKNKICIVESSFWEKHNNKFKFTIKANRFIHHMVRFLVGTMLEVSRGRYKVGNFLDLINNKITTNIVAVKAPSKGLILSQVFYED